MTKATDVAVETDPIALKLRKSQEDAAPTSAAVLTSAPVDAQNAAKKPPKAPPPSRSSKRSAPLKISKLTTAAKKVAQPSKIAVTSKVLSAMKPRSVTPGAELTSTNTAFVLIIAPAPISTVKLRPVKKTPSVAQLISINTASAPTMIQR